MRGDCTLRSSREPGVGAGARGGGCSTGLVGLGGGVAGSEGASALLGGGSLTGFGGGCFVSSAAGSFGSEPGFASITQHQY